MAPIKTLTSAALDGEVLHGNSLVALDFYQASCAPCRTLEPRLERMAPQYAGRLPIYRLDLERDMSVAERYGIHSIPTVLILSGGKEVARLDGLITDEDLKVAFEQALRG